MHLWLGQAARHDAQDQTSWPSQRRYRLHAQSDRLQSDPHSQTAGGVGQRPLTTSRPPQNPKAKKTSNAPISRFFSRLLEAITRREVEAGRLAADDEFRRLSVAGAAVLGGRSPSDRR